MDRSKTRLYQSRDLAPEPARKSAKTMLFHPPAPARAPTDPTPAKGIEADRIAQPPPLPATSPPEPLPAARTRDVALRPTRVLPIEQLLASESDPATEPHAQQTRQLEEPRTTPPHPVAVAGANPRLRDKSAPLSRGRKLRLVVGLVLVAITGALCLTDVRPGAADEQHASRSRATSESEAAVQAHEAEAQPSAASDDEAGEAAKPVRSARAPSPDEARATGAAPAETPARAQSKDERKARARARRQRAASAPTTTSSAPETSARKAADALAAGDLPRAATLYEALATRAPDHAVYAEAARILRARADHPSRIRD